MKPEDLKSVCSTAGEPSHCLVTAGTGSGWEVETVNGEKILDHDGSDWGVKTFVMFAPARGIGVVVFTNGSSDEFPRARIEQLILNQLISAHLSSLKLRRIEIIPFAVVASAWVHVSEGRSV